MARPGEDVEGVEPEEETGEEAREGGISPEELKSELKPIRSTLKEYGERIENLQEEVGAEEITSECPECGALLNPESLGSHLREELEPQIREEVREELEEEIEPETKEVEKEVPVTMPESEFKEKMKERLSDEERERVEELEPGVYETLDFLREQGLVEAQEEE